VPGIRGPAERRLVFAPVTWTQRRHRRRTTPDTASRFCQILDHRTLNVIVTLYHIGRRVDTAAESHHHHHGFGTEAMVQHRKGRHTIGAIVIDRCHGHRLEAGGALRLSRGELRMAATARLSLHRGAVKGILCQATLRGGRVVVASTAATVSRVGHRIATADANRSAVPCSGRVTVDERGGTSQESMPTLGRTRGLPRTSSRVAQANDHVVESVLENNFAAVDEGESGLFPCCVAETTGVTVDDICCHWGQTRLCKL
jgi:hypothetical protein